jgi:hypothetical protein
MQSAPNSAACRTPVHFAAGWGGRHRSSPTGGAAKGMPLKDATPSATTPCSSPLSTRTTGGACDCATVPTPIAAANAASEQTKNLVTPEATLTLSPCSARIPLLLSSNCSTTRVIKSGRRLAQAATGAGMTTTFLEMFVLSKFIALALASVDLRLVLGPASEPRYR